jgi:pyruvate-formate lyase-activating enzyme
MTFIHLIGIHSFHSFLPYKTYYENKYKEGKNMKETNNVFGKEYEFVLHWCITKTCNFSCPQCAVKADKLRGKYVPEKINILELKRFLKKTDKTAEIVFTGGEPLLVKNIIKVLAEVTKRHYVVLITNLVSDRVKELVQKVKRDHIYIKASAHFSELERFQLLDKFFANYHLLAENGFTIEVAEVAYPFILDKVGFYKKICQDQGITLEFQAFKGEWQNKKYPESYTEDEIRIFHLEKNNAYRSDIYHHQGELCNAGYNVAIMYNYFNKGLIYPCFSIFEPIGDIKKGIDFSDTMIKCPKAHCDVPVQIMDTYLFEKALERMNPK